MGGVLYDHLGFHWAFFAATFFILLAFILVQILPRVQMDEATTGYFLSITRP
jgi:hypothetical protein